MPLLREAESFRLSDAVPRVDTQYLWAFAMKDPLSLLTSEVVSCAGRGVDQIHRRALASARHGRTEVRYPEPGSTSSAFDFLTSH